MSRLPPVTRDKLSTQNQAVWDRVMVGRSGAGGPYGALFHVPALAERVGAVENYFRSDGTLAAVDRELIILTTARELGAHYPWNRHEIRGREAGMRAEAIEALRANGALDALTAHERLLVEIVKSILRQHQVADDLFARGLAELGPEKMVEMVALVGHYCLIGSIANTFGVAVAEGTVTF
ncbi:MAG TPA: carboxymuconolactone decarboxylase family protein [Candidatus Acidoferrales bacterium]|nr:carboxymuconolactone decarboxylase family protein [Candidatus Acidoferrales bacterium]